jgi:hypothetical protein
MFYSKDSVVRCWSLTDGSFLLQGLAVEWPHSPPISVLLPNGELLAKPSTYLLIDGQGNLLEFYPPPYAYSLEDTLYILDIRAVVDSDFCEFMWQQTWRREPLIEQMRTLLTGLKECDIAELPF